MQTFVLILVLATSHSSQSGATSVVQEFSSQVKCATAAQALTEDAWRRGNYIVTYGCFPK